MESFRRGAWSLIGGLLALVLAGLGEALAASNRSLPLSGLLYLLGAGLFAATAPRSRIGPSGSPEPIPAGEVAERRRLLRLLFVGTVIAVVIGLAAGVLLQRSLRSAAGLWLWLASLATLGATAVAVRKMPGWPARWGTDVWPTTARGRSLLAGAIIVLVILAAAGRLLRLDSIPFGINPDEGDRAADSIRILRGTHESGILEAGWYRISMIYFWLLAQWMKLAGIGYAQARVFGALASIVSVIVVAWIGIRHFGVRVGLLAGFFLALLGLSLQFARETSEAGPTATLWAVSAGLLLEGARRGKPWAWIGAGLSGGFAIYFYPTGRLWALLAVAFCLYLLLHGLGRNRKEIIWRVALAAIAALLVMEPFFILMSKNPGMFALRAQETSIFTNDNVRRLSYYNPEWGTLKLVAVQTVRSFGLFNRIGDNAGFWPTDRPIMSHPLAVLTLLGLGWCCLRWRDPRFVALALWFLIGFVGVIVTVETPNVQRMATGVPVLALFPALLLDDVARRAEAAVTARRGSAVPAVRWATTAAAALIAAWIMAREARFYFRDYAAMDRWSYTRIETQAVSSQGADTLVTSLGRSFHQVNSGWVRLMASETPRGGIPSPGSDLPLALPADRNLAFLVYPRQTFYLPFLRELYPHGSTQQWKEPAGQLVVMVYRLLRSQWDAAQGSLVEAVGRTAIRVPELGEMPAGWTNEPARMRWTAGLRVPRYWNYSFRIASGARLTIDGVPVLDAPGGAPASTTTVALARGRHSVVYEAFANGTGQPALFEWAIPSDSVGRTPAAQLDWRRPRREELTPGPATPVGLLGVVRFSDRPQQRRIDGTLATCCLSEEVGAQRYSVTWTGTLTAPTTGAYVMELLAAGAATLKLDGQMVLRTDTAVDTPVSGTARLSAGPHAVELGYQVSDGRGDLEWIWSPPGGERSIVPPSVLSPPAGGGISRAVPADALGPSEMQPIRSPLTTIR